MDVVVGADSESVGHVVVLDSRVDLHDVTPLTPHVHVVYGTVPEGSRGPSDGESM